jgi:hypothetical protein
MQPSLPRHKGSYKKLPTDLLMITYLPMPQMNKVVMGYLLAGD